MSRRTMSTIPMAQTIASGMRIKVQTAADVAMTVKLRTRSKPGGCGSTLR
jgi:hypothetical protein